MTCRAWMIGLTSAATTATSTSIGRPSRRVPATLHPADRPDREAVRKDCPSLHGVLRPALPPDRDTCPHGSHRGGPGRQWSGGLRSSDRAFHRGRRPRSGRLVNIVRRRDGLDELLAPLVADAEVGLEPCLSGKHGGELRPRLQCLLRRRANGGAVGGVAALLSVAAVQAAVEDESSLADVFRIAALRGRQSCREPAARLWQCSS